MTRARDLAAGTIELATGGVLKLETSDTTVTDGSVLGKIEFKAPDEASGTDAILVGAAIEAVAEGTFAADNNATELVFKTGASAAADTKMTLTSGGNVGIGVAPADSNSFGKALDVGSATGAALYLRDVDGSKVGIVGQFNEQLSLNAKQSDGNIGFYTGASNTQRMLVDSSGNLLVGGTTTNHQDGSSQEQFSYINGSFLAVSRSGATVAYFNRQSDDGEIAAFRKNGTTVGSIGTQNGDDFYIASGSTANTGLRFQTDEIVPVTDGAANRDNAIDLGKSNIRFDDIFATNGTVQTSDRNEKQNIAALTSAEMLVAKRISALFKTFRWKDKVAAKGDNARTHTGIIAQDVQAAFTAESLDAGDYSLFISSTWWEHDVDVAAVEADDTVTPPIEAVDAYTRTDTYDTEDEAPSGSTSRTRLGIRYPELLSFVAAYNEQRFAAIETRLTALEG